MNEKINILWELLGGLEYQTQIRDNRMRVAPNREGVVLFRI